jgi:hypothetical protein
MNARGKAILSIAFGKWSSVLPIPHRQVVALALEGLSYADTQRSWELPRVASVSV